jgi:hypothetical protein
MVPTLGSLTMAGAVVMLFLVYCSYMLLTARRRRRRLGS